MRDCSPCTFEFFLQYSGHLEKVTKPHLIRNKMVTELELSDFEQMVTTEMEQRGVVLGAVEEDPSKKVCAREEIKVNFE
jgi:hypothetical protein